MKTERLDNKKSRVRVYVPIEETLEAEFGVIFTNYNMVRKFAEMKDDTKDRKFFLEKARELLLEQLNISRQNLENTESHPLIKSDFENVAEVADRVYSEAVEGDSPYWLRLGGLSGVGKTYTAKEILRHFLLRNELDKFNKVHKKALGDSTEASTIDTVTTQDKIPNIVYVRFDRVENKTGDLLKKQLYELRRCVEEKREFIPNQRFVRLTNTIREQTDPEVLTVYLREAGVLTDEEAEPVVNGDPARRPDLLNDEELVEKVKSVENMDSEVALALLANVPKRYFTDKLKDYDPDLNIFLLASSYNLYFEAERLMEKYDICIVEASSGLKETRAYPDDIEIHIQNLNIKKRNKVVKPKVAILPIHHSMTIEAIYARYRTRLQNAENDIERMELRKKIKDFSFSDHLDPVEDIEGGSVHVVKKVRELQRSLLEENLENLGIDKFPLLSELMHLQELTNNPDRLNEIKQLMSMPYEEILKRVGVEYYARLLKTAYELKDYITPNKDSAETDLYLSAVNLLSVLIHKDIIESFPRRPDIVMYVYADPEIPKMDTEKREIVLSTIHNHEDT